MKPIVFPDIRWSDITLQFECKMQNERIVHVNVYTSNNKVVYE